jgi:hypothetical protein
MHSLPPKVHHCFGYTEAKGGTKSPPDLVSSPLVLGFENISPLSEPIAKRHTRTHLRVDHR